MDFVCLWNSFSQDNKGQSLRTEQKYHIEVLHQLLKTANARSPVIEAQLVKLVALALDRNLWFRSQYLRPPDGIEWGKSEGSKQGNKVLLASLMAQGPVHAALVLVNQENETREANQSAVKPSAPPTDSN